MADFNIWDHYDPTISTTPAQTVESAKFRPVRGLDAKIQNMEYHDGWLYFATDTGKIYIDAEGKNKSLMGGGGTALFYAHDQSVEKKPGGIYLLSLDTLDSASNIKRDDLIINENDGCFYKVSSIDFNTNIVTCSLLAVSGTGGGSHPGGGSTSTLSLTVTNIAGSKIFVYGEPFYITATPMAQLSAMVTLVYEVIGSNGTRTYSAEVKSGESHSFDIGSLLFEGLNDISVYARTDNDGETYLTYSRCKAVVLSLTSQLTEQQLVKVYTESTTFYVVPVGEYLSKTISVFIDDLEIPELRQTVTSSGATVAITLPGQKHGAHKITISMTADVGGVQISVPSLQYEMAWKEEDNNTPIVWFGTIPSTVTNYDVVKVPYVVYDPAYSTGRTFDINLRRDGKTYTSRDIEYNGTSFLIWNISDYALGKNEYGITRGSATRDFEFEIVADTTRNMDIVTAGLYLNLDSTGRSNAEKTFNRNQWTYTNKLSPSTSFNVEFNDFNWYNNGWIEDETGISALRISNGASIDIPLTKVLKTSNLDGARWTFEFRFKVHNVQNYRTLLNISGEAEGDTSSSLASDWADNAFAIYYSGGAGFCLGPSDVFFSGGDVMPNVRYKADEMINCSIVIDGTNNLIYIYINGIMSKVIACTNQNFYVNRSMLTIDSSSCDIDLYKVRVYQTALTHSEIVQNYIADQKDVGVYDANNITAVDKNSNPTISLSKVQTYNVEHLNAPLMPYAILKVNDENVTNDLLPFIKDEEGDGIRCDVTFINSPLDAAFATKELATTAAAAGMSVEDYYSMHAPSFKATQAWVNVQGTSSQGYPRRNYKIKFKKSKTFKMHKGPFEQTNKDIKKIQLDDPIGENAVTWKADYMESSGTHNTGFTSYVKTLYSRHPLQDYYDDDDIDNLRYMRTTIYGFPMMVFQEHADGSFEYIGKYNFNYDKSCPNVLGFECENDHPYVPNAKMNEIAECWELCNNKGTRCSFAQVDFDEVASDSIDEETGEVKPGGSLTVLDDFEIRYNYYKDDVEEWMKNPGIENNLKILEKYENLRKLCDWLYYLHTNPSPGAKNYFTGALENPVIYDTITYTEDNAEYRKAKFKAEFEQHFNLEYCLIYFIMTELIVAYDSRGKNMMLASWGPQAEGGEYIWYPIFYDVDTQLGINNSGVPLWDYDVNPSDNQVFSTPDSVLWNNFYACFLPQIRAKYADLRSKNLKFETLNGYYDFDPNVSKSYAMQGIRPYVAYNADEYFKYIAPARQGEGYITTEGKVDYTDTYYYCAQGTRELQRELFLTNRFYYLDSKWRGNYFSNTNKDALAQIRVNYNAKNVTSDTSVGNDDYPNAYDVPPYFEFTPFLNSYPSFYVDDSFYGGTAYTAAGNPQQISVGNELTNVFKNGELQTNKGQLVYLGGKEYLSDIGDISRYYVDELKLGGANKLTRLLVGSDLEGYRNDLFIPGGNIIFDTTIGYPLLEYINFSKLANYVGALDFSKSEKLSTFRGLGSGITGLKLADGVQLHTCYLPASVTAISFTQANELSNILDDTPVSIDGEWEQGLYIEGLTNKLHLNDYSNTTTNITSLYLDGGKLGTESYRLLHTLIKIKQAMFANSDASLNKNLSVHLTDVAWCPYVVVESGANHDDNITYYQLTDHYTFIPYMFSTNKQWNQDTLNGKIYELIGTPNTSPITDLSLLDTFIDSANGVIDGDWFHDLTGNFGTMPYLSGAMYVNNDSDHPISEVDIKNKYNKYYPDLKIYVNNVTTALTVNYIEVKNAESGEEYIWDVQKYSKTDTSAQIQKIATIVTKPDYDFVGWSLTKGATEPDVKEPTDYTIQEILQKAQNDVVNFYAVFTIHEYEFKFFNFDGSSLNNTTESIVLKIPAGNTLYAPNTVVPYRDDSDLGKYQTWNFDGYTQEQNSNTLVDFTAMTAKRDMVFYAHFNYVADVRTIIHPEYFSSIDVHYSETGFGWGNEDFNIGNGVRLKLSVPVKGKITIPATFNGKPVVELDSTFSGASAIESGHTPGIGNGLTYVFFEEGSSMRRFENYAFANNSSLIEVEYPESLRQIGDSCFRNCPKINIPNNYIGNNIVKIGQFCYTGSGSFYKKDPIQSLSIGESVVAVGYSAFGYIGRQINELWLGSQEHPSAIDFSYTTIINGKRVFMANPGTPILTLYFYCNGRYTQIDFQDNYCGSNVTVAYVG